jgi:hypothetical protein
LEYVLFSINTGLDFFIKGSLLIIEVCSDNKDGFVTFNNTILNLLMNAFLNSIHALLGDSELIAVMLSH